MTQLNEPVLQNAFYVIASGILLAIFARIQSVKKDTSQVNNAVNHVDPGKKPLTQRVDRIEENLHTVQYDMDIAKKAAMEVAHKVDQTADDLTQTKNMVEGLMVSHVETKKELLAALEDIKDVIPKRKTD